MRREILHLLQQKTSRTWFAALAGLAILLACALSFSLPYAEPDLWGHVQFGRDALQNGLPRTTSYSFTAAGHTWINHENLSEVTFALAVDQLGVWSLLVAKCLLGMFIVATIGWRARRNGASWLVTSSVVLLFAATVGSYWQVRPQIVSFGFFALLVLLLDTVFRGWNEQWHLPWLKDDARFDRERPLRLPKQQLHWLWLAAPLFALWANSHGGFIAGYCFFAAYLCGRGCEIWYQRRDQAPETIGLLAVIAVVAGLSTLATPYGIDLHRWLLHSLQSPRPEITEWHPLSRNSEAFLPFVTLGALSVMALIFSRRALDATHLLLLSLTTWQALSHQRHVPFAAIVICLWLPVHWKSVSDRLRTKKHQTELAPLRWMQLALIGVNLLLLGVLVTRLTWLRVDRGSYPVAAVKYMNDQQLNGRLVVTYNWAQYLIGAFGEEGARSPSDLRNTAPGETTVDARGRDDARVQVAFDGRFRTCYPQTIVDEHFDFVLGRSVETGRFRTSDADPYRTLRTGHPDLVLISRNQVPSTQVMEQQTDWVLLYQDSIAQLWGRKDKYADPESPHFVQAKDRITGEGLQQGYVTWPAFPTSRQPEMTVAAEANTTVPVALTDPRDTSTRTKHDRTADPKSALEL